MSGVHELEINVGSMNIKSPENDNLMVKYQKLAKELELLKEQSKKDKELRKQNKKEIELFREKKRKK